MGSRHIPHAHVSQDDHHNGSYHYSATYSNILWDAASRFQNFASELEYAVCKSVVFQVRGCMHE
jgi:hypothetical protein